MCGSWLGSGAYIVDNVQAKVNGACMVDTM